MANPMSANWPAHWPKYLPLPRAIGRSRGPVPNASSVNWPQAQFAPLYLEPGSASFQPYSYLKNDVPYAEQQPVYTAFVPKALGPASVNTYRGGPDGDIARLPLGGLMHNNPSPRRIGWIAVNSQRSASAAAVAAGRQSTFRQRLAANKRARKLAKLQKRARKSAWRRRRAAAHASFGDAFGAPTARWGARSSGVPIPTGVPDMGEAPMPNPIATAGLTSLYSGLALDNMGGLALDNMGGLALDNTSALGGMDFLKDEAGAWDVKKIGGIALVGLIAFKAYKRYM